MRHPSTQKVHPNVSLVDARLSPAHHPQSQHHRRKSERTIPMMTTTITPSSALTTRMSTHCLVSVGERVAANLPREAQSLLSLSQHRIGQCPAKGPRCSGINQARRAVPFDEQGPFPRGVRPAGQAVPARLGIVRN